MAGSSSLWLTSLHYLNLCKACLTQTQALATNILLLPTTTSKFWVSSYTNILLVVSFHLHPTFYFHFLTTFRGLLSHSNNFQLFVDQFQQHPAVCWPISTTISCLLTHFNNIQLFVVPFQQHPAVCLIPAKFECFTQMISCFLWSHATSAHLFIVSLQQHFSWLCLIATISSCWWCHLSNAPLFIASSLSIPLFVVSFVQCPTFIWQPFQ